MASYRDLLLGIAVVVAMSAAYLSTGEFILTAPTSSVPAIVPVVICVARDPVNAGSYIASFGYLRADGGPVVRVPYAPSGAMLNYITVGDRPLAQGYGVPAEFVVGFQRDQFAVRALETQSITWWLTSDQARSAVATSRTQPVCAVAPSLPVMPSGGTG